VSVLEQFTAEEWALVFNPYRKMVSHERRTLYIDCVLMLLRRMRSFTRDDVDRAVMSS
jgi:hypothetical protein